MDRILKISSLIFIVILSGTSIASAAIPQASIIFSETVHMILLGAGLMGFGTMLRELKA